ncbi:hypothetical protein [Halotia branconii]|uniref:Uncharacterized protein n=1 Tax=Halotia branconii CENA392 TaxID=1539056 RepID=A0AAJ6NT85_9CYAN|nr:hypothetical protein [Halotia branconii]WGV26290.1 hypothetical protein QI031_01895 [Halotia branconii CENA392]
MTQVQNFDDNQNFSQVQSEQYLPSEDFDAPTLKSAQNSSPKREQIKHLLIGSPKAVTSTIHFLQVIGYANVGDWSQLIPTENPNEVMSILIRQILTQ